MSATNTTTNYGLPIFIETDKPAWLVDFNGAMRTIDATLKTNADAIATKSPILTFNDTNEIDFTKTGDIVTAHLASGVSDKVGRALVTPISAPASEQLVGINTAGSQEYLNIGSGLYNDNGTLKAIDMNLIDVHTVNIAAGGLPSGVTSSGGIGLKIALNASKTIGKIYGYFTLTASGSASSGRFHLDSGVDVAATGEEYLIGAVAMNFKGTALDQTIVHATVSATGRLAFNIAIAPGSTNNIWFPPCIYFFTNFGDIVTP